MYDETSGASAGGLIQCLRMLTEEAATLNLTSTCAILREAVATCSSEIDIARRREVQAWAMHRKLPGGMLH